MKFINLTVPVREISVMDEKSSKEFITEKGLHKTSPEMINKFKRARTKMKQLELSILKDKKSTIMSSEEALKDVKPFFNEEEINQFWSYPGNSMNETDYKRIIAKMDKYISEIPKQSLEESRQFLINVGVLDKDGEISEVYRNDKNKGEK
jgi:hypothetical protein